MEDSNKKRIHSLIFQIKKWGVDKWLILLLGGILLLIVCIPVKKNEVDSEYKGGISIQKDSLTDTMVSQNAGLMGGFSYRQGWVTEDAIEQQLIEILQKIDGVGQVDVMITGNAEYNQIEGVVVVADGADVPIVRQEIIETVQALFPIAAYKVKVCKMAGGIS
ncbi:MAG: hypothetical protein IJ079_10370 [Lachnospiraceae bacterium]|nr:hypothetical protein [Lachnospiraceae bacterium]